VERLRIARAKAGMTLMELEAASGVGASTISKIERGVTQPQAITLQKLADAVGVEVEELLPKVIGGSAHLQARGNLRAAGEVIPLLEAVWNHELTPEEAAPHLALVGASNS
jgi:transcriptional regulator with XRE-family HTH domain